jgi:hypothetical protein
MKSLISRDAKKITLHILRVLSVRLDTKQISNAFDKALERYLEQNREPKNHTEFNQEIARCIQIIYRIGVKPGQSLSAQEAMAKAIDLLDRYCNNHGSRGYEAAYLDVVYSGEASIGDVCYQLFQMIKEHEIRKYQNYVYSTTINPLDWQLHLDITKGIIELFGEYLPPLIVESPPERFSGFYKDLIDMVLSSQDIAANISSGSSSAFQY